jgi:hypothetical protein
LRAQLPQLHPKKKKDKAKHDETKTLSKQLPSKLKSQHAAAFVPTPHHKILKICFPIKKKKQNVSLCTMPDTYIQLALRPFPTLRNVYIESANIYTVHLPQQQIKEEWDLKKKT